MVRSIVLVSLVSMVLATSARAAAQDEGALGPDRPRIEVPRLEVDDELASIDAESHAATALYVLSPVLLGASVGLVVAAYAVNPICISFTGGCSGDPAAAAAFGATGVVALGLSALSLGLAIGLDVDSGSRRDGLRMRQASARLGIGAAAGGASLVLAGSF